MANVFAILTAIVLALASFIAYKNKEAYQKEISATGNETHLKDAKNKANPKKDSKEDRDYDAKNFDPKTYEALNAKDKLGFYQGWLARLTRKITENKDAQTAVEKEIADLREDQSKKQENISKLNDEIAKKADAYKPGEEQLKTLKQQTEKLGDLTELAAKMRKLKTDVEELTQLNDTADAKLANLTAQNNQTENLVKSSKDKIEKFASGQSLATLNTRIRTIYPTWGFVTLAAGNNAGVVGNSTLDVVRNGSTIAKLLVTSVEGTTASASIIPDSLAQDTVLMVGDKVVPAAKAVAAPAAPKPTTTPGKPAATPVAKPDPTTVPDPATAPDPTTAPDPAATPATPAADATPAPASN